MPLRFHRIIDAAGLCAPIVAFFATAQAVAAGDRSAALEAAIATVTAEELREHDAFLADDTLEGRAAGSRGGRAAARYLETRLQSAGLKPAGDGGRYTQRFNPGYQNVLGLVPGTDPKLRDEFILVGAHYDHVGYGSWRNSNGPVGYIHNGADDNASGVAALLEMIDALSRTHWQPRRSILFAFWDGEEINLLGSRHWVRQPTLPIAKLRVAINADMVGRMKNGRLEVSGTRTAPGLRRLFSSSRLAKGMWIDFPWDYQDNSDHWPFFEAGIPSLLVHTGLHDDYHRPSDDVEKLNVPGMRSTAAYMLEAACRLADEEQLPSFRPASRAENSYTRRTREAPLGALPARLGLRWRWQQREGEPVMTVSGVTRGSAADKAGLRVGDRLVAVDGAAIENESLLPAAVLRAPSEITLDVLRADAKVSEQDEEAKPESIRVPLTGQPVKIGLSWREDPAAPGSVLITRVVPYSPAARAGARVHDRIYSIQGEPFADQDALLKRINELADDEQTPIHLEIERAGRLGAVDIDLKLPSAPPTDATL
jgi:hypothetical protein